MLEKKLDDYASQGRDGIENSAKTLETCPATQM